MGIADPEKKIYGTRTRGIQCPPTRHHPLGVTLLCERVAFAVQPDYYRECNISILVRSTGHSPAEGNDRQSTTLLGEKNGATYG